MKCRFDKARKCMRLRASVSTAWEAAALWTILTTRRWLFRDPLKPLVATGGRHYDEISTDSDKTPGQARRKCTQRFAMKTAASGSNCCPNRRHELGTPTLVSTD